MNFVESRRRLKVPPLGLLSLAAFVIAAVTGIMLVPAFKASAALDSLVLLSLKNPAGVYVRSVHYWSAQFFLALTLAHIVDHLLRHSERDVRFGVWVRLVLSIPVVFAVMLSGFLLRADASATEALEVLRSLLGLIPWLGSLMTPLLTGSGSDLSVVYLHHACTATIILWLITVEHSRRILPGRRAAVWMLPPALLLALLFVPGLAWQAHAVEKAPWYLVGLQEMLRWTPNPRVVLWIGTMILLALIALPRLSLRARSRTTAALAMTASVYGALTLVALGFRGDGWQFTSPRRVLAGTSDFLPARAYVPVEAKLVRVSVPIVSDHREGCLACHKGMKGLISAHDPETIGCASCHLGNPWTLDKELAHAGMTRTPGNLSVVDQTCGTSNCHRDQAARVHHSLMNTMSGVVAVDKYAFGENGDLDAQYDVAALGHSPADSHLRNLCASCHLGQDKAHPGPINETDRGGGCSACHLRYDAASEAELHLPAGSAASTHHPDNSLHIPSEACFGCHSRSGRISTSFEGWHETLMDEKAAKASNHGSEQIRVLADSRVFMRHPADVHAEKGMTCVDCHLASEVMGDGSNPAHENEAIRTSCVDCHAVGRSETKDFAHLDPETQQIVAMRKLNEPGRQFVEARNSEVAYPNVYLDAERRPVLSLMSGAQLLQPKPMARACAAGIHKRLDCNACHTAWAPQCITCHTSFDPKDEGFDHLAGKFVRGAWQERPDHYLSDAPALGVESALSARGFRLERITTFVPGMILHLDGASDSKQSGAKFRRLFAPASAHTTAAHARDCRSCHTNPAALGYGRGQLKYVVTGRSAKWQLIPEFTASPEDGLPQDAWIGFLEEPGMDLATRKGARPFTLEEQRRILLVGACLACHSEKEPRVAEVFSDFAHYRTAIGPHCILPDWGRVSEDSGGSAR